MNKTYEPKSFESDIYKQWEDKGYFKSSPNKNKKPFSIVMPPPNITGQLHVGHALDNAVQDSIIRYKRMKGFETLWVPGTDHASIATEVKIVEKLKNSGKTKEQIGRDAFLKLAYEWKDEYGGRIISQLKKVGSSCDWDRLAFTMDEKCSKAVREVFVNMYEKELIYQGDRIINWCPCCKTALSDAEVEFEESSSYLWSIKYPLENSSEFITVATTRPETMLGDTAIAVNPNDKRYKKLVGKNVLLPLTNRIIPIIADNYVEMKFGTGAVKITPAHDPNDFEVGQRHNLPLIKVISDDGTMAENAGVYKKLPREKARTEILKDLEKLNLLIETKTHINNVGHCYRCHTIIEPLISKQWFVKMQPLSVPAINGVKDGDIKVTPKHFEKTYLHWMENIRDWCISRQLWWGHRIPAFYCDKCGHMEVSKTDIKCCSKCGGSVSRDEDVLDTWFSSALWPFSTLGFPDKSEDLDYYYPTSVLVTAYDIIFFWVARMIFSGYEHMGKKPFDEVLLHGLVRDEKGRKMSKSLGNGIDPLQIIDEYGADTLRISLISGISAGNDMRFSTDKIGGYRNFMNKIWNASRFVLMNCENADIIPFEKIKTLSLADKWIITKLNDTIIEVTKYMDKYEVGLAATKLYDFIWTEFCDWYIELSKTSLYSEDKSKRSNTVGVLLYCLRTLLKLVHPIIPFITEEIYLSLPNKDAESIMISSYPTPSKSFKKDAADMDKIMAVIKGIRNIRAEMNVSQSKRTEIYIVPRDGYDQILKSSSLYIEKLASGLSVEFVKPSVKSASIVLEVADVYLPVDELIDYKGEKERLTKELKDISSEISRAEGKLKNEGFVNKAPKELIESEKDKLKKFIAIKEKLEKSLAEVELEL